ncbi:hypothetical protein GGR54DRAFT_629609 [Hypoxylon sp. NC1633]|nr:hypothetical protein GGR54DRAFT_629609 [Hypoxylon sp. NC1633]
MASSFGMGSLFAAHLLNVSGTAAATRFLILITAWAQFATIGAAQKLPYIPTNIFVPSSKPVLAQENASSNVAYIFSPQDDWVNLLALDFSGGLHASSLSFQTLSSNVPFLDTNNTAFSPSLADNGSLIVYAGDCSSSANPEIWTFNPSSKDDASSSWAKETLTLSTEADTVQGGPSFLGGSFSFSTTLAPELSQAETYVYGGMCPDAASNASAPQSEATYSNQMIKISPSEAGAGQLTVAPVSSKGPPVAEAGFTFTSLSPSISNRSGVVTQQVNYVLLGGHTKNAFINMSTAAIWSLPEGIWSFISSIGTAGSGGANTELTVKSTFDRIDSRSGHTTVLSEDGTSLIILGGWVGDLTQAAMPQLAILNIGSSYGGSGDWEWSVPNTQPSAPGIYGHGAALLPGNVMVVYGGYNISPAGTNNKRQASGSNEVPMFLNLTSMTWSDDYTNPQTASTGKAGSSTGASDDAKTRLGLGLGLGLGLAAIIAAIILYFWYRRRLRHKRTIRESAIRALAQDTSRFLPPEDEMADSEHAGGWYTGGPDPYMRGGRSLGYQSLQTGRGSLDHGRPSWFGGGGGPGMPAQAVARKPLPRRNTYDPPTGSRGSGAIHPIIEAADEDGSLHDGGGASVSGDNNVVNEPAGGRRDSDPFLTPTHEPSISFPPPSRGSLTPSPEERRRSNAATPTTDPEVRDWMSDVEAMDALLSGRGAARLNRLSGGGSGSGGGGAYIGDEDARTESMVSESGRSRSDSMRSHLRLGFGIAMAAAADEGRGGSSSSSSAPSYNTARSSFPALRAEGPGLLLGAGRGGRDGDGDGDEGPPGSPSKSKPRRSWLLGSLRRVLSGSTPSPSPPGSDGKESPVGDAFGEGLGGDFDARLGGLSGIAAGGLLRRKSGRSAWEALEQAQSMSAGNGKGKKRGRGAADQYHERYVAQEEDDDDDEWDIEKAVERRLVQVMFTVPKEPLRVVNAEPDIESGKDVVVVDPDDEEEVVEEKARKPEEQAMERDLGIPIPTPSPLSEEERELGADDEKEALREIGEELEAEWKRDVDRGRQIRTPLNRTPVRDEGARLLGVELTSESRKRKPSRSPVEDPEGEVYDAQAVKLERPRTRVLAMVESIESLKREDSPAGSPSR